MNALIVAGAIVALIGVFLTLYGALWLAERYIPGLSGWLDRHVGTEPDWMKPW